MTDETKGYSTALVMSAALKADKNRGKESNADDWGIAVQWFNTKEDVQKAYKNDESGMGQNQRAARTSKQSQ